MPQWHYSDQSAVETQELFTSPVELSWVQGESGRPAAHSAGFPDAQNSSVWGSESECRKLALWCPNEAILSIWEAHRRGFRPPRPPQRPEQSPGKVKSSWVPAAPPGHLLLGHLREVPMEGGCETTSTVSICVEMSSQLAAGNPVTMTMLHAS